ncbi:MAG: NUDIX hydrolase [Pseudomonadota bacterium]
MSTHQRNILEQLPISLSGRHKTDLRSQFGALCYRVRKDEKVEVLLITSRSSGRWIIPKGWPIDGKTPADTAAVEAWEEAGARGVSDGRCVGIFSYRKSTEDMGTLPCVAMVFAIEVVDLEMDFPESEQRERKWVTRKQAAKLVDEPELARIIRDFEPGLRG